MVLAWLSLGLPALVSLVSARPSMLSPVIGLFVSILFITAALGLWFPDPQVDYASLSASQRLELSTSCLEAVYGLRCGVDYGCALQSDGGVFLHCFPEAARTLQDVLRSYALPVNHLAIAPRI